ncbi:hypothetical protein NY10_783 [Carnobacterium antarcticum]|nr:hypothetical protein NY10_783 [Carnobacterium sp. CP1]
MDKAKKLKMGLLTISSNGPYEKQTTGLNENGKKLRLHGE